MRFINHCLSKRMVEMAKAKGRAIALENLSGIRSGIGPKAPGKSTGWISGWNFRELATFIEYKAALAGVPVVCVDPKETSKTCPECGNVSGYKRKTRGWFTCVRYGYQSDADRVGACNIAAKALDALGA